MPVISTLFGIVTRMFYREHGIAHFHAEYQGQQATFTLEGTVLAGAIRSPTALRLIQAWSTAHRDELQANWQRMKSGEPLERVEPLDREDPMDVLPQVIRAEYRGGHTIHLAFNDGLEGSIDFAQWLDGPVFEALKDAAYFRRFFLDGGTVAWPNGADIAPETLHERVKASAAA